MMKGKVKWYSEEKGYGFVIAENGKEYFFHKTGMSPEFQPFEGAKVVFDEGEGRKGLKAVNMRAENLA